MWHSDRGDAVTGVYWIAVYDILEAAGFDVYSLMPRYKESAGAEERRAGEQWLMKLHTYGCCGIRSAVAGDPHDAHYWRQRNDLIRTAVSHIQRIQKALTQMNIQLANVLSDVSGVTGQAILKAILAGERDRISWPRYGILG